MGPHPVLITGLQLAITVAAGLLAGPSRPRRAGAMALAIVALGFPFVLPNEMVILRGILGFHGSVALLRVIDLVRDPGGLSAGRRVLAVITLVDTRQMERTSERFAVSEWLPIGVFAGLSAAGWWTALQLAPRLDHPASSFGLRWLGALVGFYAVFDAFMRSSRAVYRLGGYRLPLLHDNPVLSKSVQEFWSRRWNRVISGWLHTHCMRPLAARRHPRAGVLAAFAASGVLHFWQTFVCLPLRYALMAGAYFVLQAIAMLIERRWGVRRWPAIPARAWTVAAVGAPSFLLIVPLLRYIGAA